MASTSIAGIESRTGRDGWATTELSVTGPLVSVGAIVADASGDSEGATDALPGLDSWMASASSRDDTEASQNTQTIPAHSVARNRTSSTLRANTGPTARQHKSADAEQANENHQPATAG